ncbi:MAG: UvrB/UvrC motif-containing protein [Planctomycetota bacterium]|jgi:protein arginine kinase activator
MSPILCQSCGDNPATIHFTEIKNETKRELHICEACANAQGLGGGAHIPAMLANLVQGVRRGGLASDVKCPDCGITFDEFRTKGRFGCPRDYEVFGEAMGPLLEKIHRASRHVGRLPRGRASIDTNVADRLLRLRRDLQAAVEGEKYEQAANLRDEIRKLEAAPAEGATPDRGASDGGRSGDADVGTL